MLKTSAVRLAGGLDFSNPRSLVEPGRLVDCLNYEHIDNSGIKKIDGIQRWDGGCDPKSEQLFTMIVELNVPPTPVVQVLSRSGVDGTSGIFGLIQKVEQRTDLHLTVAYELTYLVLDTENTPRYGDLIYTLAPSGVSTLIGSLDSITHSWVRIPQPADFGTAEEIKGTYNFGAESTNGPRSPSSYYVDSAESDDQDFRPAPVLGGVYFKDKFYAVVDSAIELSVDGPTARVYPNDILTNAAGTSCALVLEATLTSGTWTSGSGTATVYVAPIIRRPSPTVVSNEYRVGGAYIATSTPTSNLRYLARTGAAWTPVASIEVNQESLFRQSSAKTASIWKSYSERQALDLGGVASVTITDSGAGYDSAPAVSFTGDGTGAKAYAIMTGSAGALTVAQIVVTDPGKGYTSPPTVVLTGGTPTVTFEAAADAVLMGWEHSGLVPNHNGWLVKFDAGKSPSNYFTKIDRSTNIASQTVSYTTAPTTSSYPRKVLTGLDFSDAINNAMLQWYPSTGSDLNSTTILDGLNSDPGEGINCLMRETDANYNWQTNTIGFTQFRTTGTPPLSLGTCIPQNSIINGVTVKVTLHADVAATLVGQINYLKMRCNLFTSTNTVPAAQTNPLDPEPSRSETRHGNTQELSLTIPTADGNVTSVLSGTSPVTFGSSTDLWGLIDKRDDFFRNPDFGVAISLHAQRTDSGTFADVTFQIEKVEIIVDYATGTSKYYFSDGTGNVMSAQLVDYAVLSGSLKNGDAIGYMQLSKLEQHAIFATTPISSIVDNMNIYADSSLTALVGVVNGDMTYNGLPNYPSIQEAASRYKLKAANFYGNEDWECIYGVSGAGRAFEFDGNYFSTVFGLPPEAVVGSNTINEGNDAKDTPRHVDEFDGSLCLGYRSGSVLSSRAGYPLEFSGLRGARENVFGDSVTGLAVLNGEYLGVFCENKIFGLDRQGARKVLSPNSGAIEHTLQMLGNTPIFCDSQGIATLQQSDKYGDFQGQRLSKDVYPWLKERLNSGVGISGGQSGIVDSYVVRTKNHYRLWFADGYQLVMNYFGEGDPQFTIMRYNFKAFDSGSTYNNSTSTVVPTFVSSNVADSGEEYVMFYPDISRFRDVEHYGVYRQAHISPYIYRIDRFWFVDQPTNQTALPGYFQTNYWNKDNPFVVGTVRKVRVEGRHRNYAPLVIITTADYESPDLVNGKRVDLTLENPDQVGLPVMYQSAQGIASVAETGRLIGFTFVEGRANDPMTYPYYDEATSGYIYGPASYGNFGGSFPLSPNPPHYIQILLLQHEEGRADA